MYKTSLRLFAPLALSFSLGLTACSPQPFNQPAGQSSGSASALSEPAHSAPPRSIAATQSVSFSYTSPQGFKTQVVDADDLKFIRLTLVGDGLNDTLSNAEGFVPVTGGTATVSIQNVPIQPGKVRVVTVQGYDASQQPLPAFVGKGYYTSRFGQASVTVTISRRQLLVGQVLEKLLQGNQPSQASQLNVDLLQDAVDQATGFDATTQKFTTDPTLFDPQKLVDKLAAGEIPSLALIQNNATATAGNVQISISTTGGGKFTEALSVEVNDPKSTVANIALNAPSPQQPTLSVSPGSWMLRLKKTDGTVMGSTSVTVDTNGQVTLGYASLPVTLKPEVASLTPSTLNVLGGGTVTLTGTGFTGATAVKFGSSDATNFTVNSDSQIIATAPAAPAGNTHVTVTTPGGSSDTATGNQMTYAPAPAITSLSASSGTIGSSITLTGTHFNATHGNNVVRFGTTPATTTAGNATSLTVTVPVGISGAVDISVQDGALTSANTAADDFAVVPTISGLNSTSGLTAGGGTITVTGTGFAPGATALKFGTTDASNINVTSNTSLTATIPAGTAGQVDVTAVTTGGGTSATSANSQYTYLPALTAQTSGTTSILWSVTYGNNTFVAVGNGGVVRTSTDGETWTPQTAATVAPLLGVTYGNNTFVAVGGGGNVRTSADGVTWTVQASGITTTLYGVTYGNNTFVAVGNGGTVLTSADGVTWASQASGTEDTLSDVVYGNNTFVAVDQGGGVLTSADGVTWTVQASEITTALLGVTYGNNTFVAVGQGGCVLTSADGVIWTPQASGTTQTLSSVTYANNIFVAVGQEGVVHTSVDGVTWTSQPSGTTSALYSLVYDGSKFVVVGNGGAIFTSNGL